jgi:hypothetical protein
MDILPARIMGDVLWAFRGKPFATQKEFEKVVRKYHLDILKSAERWKPNELAVPRGKVRVQYMCWRDGDQVEPVVLLASDDGKSFSQGELLYKIHNEVIADLRDLDHSFFEGLSLSKSSLKEEVPLYFISLGS